MKRDIYSGHMRKTGKKTRYTDAEIEQIKTDAFEKGRASSGSGQDGRTYDDGFNRGYHKGQIAQLNDLEYWLENAIGRPGKRQVLDQIAEIKNDLESGLD